MTDADQYKEKKNSPLARAILNAGLIGPRMDNTGIPDILNVDRHTFRQWLDGAPIAEDCLDTLASFLGTTPNRLAGKPDPITQADPRQWPEALRHIGDLSIHFRGGKQPLLLPVCADTMAQLDDAIAIHNDTEGRKHPAFIQIASLDNRIALVNLDAITDIHLYREHEDTYGPEPHETYGDQVMGLYPNPDFWLVTELIVEHIGNDDVFSLEDIHDMHPDAADSITADFIETVRAFYGMTGDGAQANPDIDLDRFADRATQVTWQFADGTMREFYAMQDDNLDIFMALEAPVCPVIEFSKVSASERTIFIQSGSLNYIVAPHHKYMEGAVAFWRSMEEDGLGEEQ